MADSKISGLTDASTPLVGTEVLPIVQSSTTKKVSIANLTAGRAVNALSYASTSGFNFNSSFTSADNYVGCDNTAGNAATLWFRKGRDIGAGSVDSVGLDSLGTSGVVPLIIRGQPVLINDGVATNKFENGNLVIGTAGKGIDFTQDPNPAGMTSELLDDYEEGTWTPADGSGAGLTLTVANAKYVKVGNLVMVTAGITYPVTADASAATISGLPFTSSGNGSTFPWTSAAVDFTLFSFSALLIPRTSANGNITNAQLSGAFVNFSIVYTI